MEETKKLPVAERVEKKMGMARYMNELYFQCASYGNERSKTF